MNAADDVRIIRLMILTEIRNTLMILTETGTALIILFNFLKTKGLVSLITYQYIVFIYIILVYIFLWNPKMISFFGKINNKNFIPD